MIIMRRTYSILILLTLLLHGSRAEAWSTISVKLHVAQPVLVTGEDLWFDGSVGPEAKEARFVHIHLLNRNGVIKAEAVVQAREGSFQGYLEMPSGLVSDYYFLDATVKGYATQVTLVPLMVINPQYPPLACPSTLATGDKLINAPGILSTDKTVYNVRDKANLQITPFPEGMTAAIYVSRADVLSDLLESVSTSFHLVRHHPARGEKELEGHTLSVKLWPSGATDSVNGVRVVAALLGGQALVSSAITDDQGKARLILPTSTGERSVVLSVVQRKGQNVRLELEEDTLKAEPIAFSCLRLEESMRAAIETRLMNFRLAKEYHPYEVRQFQFEDADTSDFYGKPDKRYLLDDYVRFPNMQEILEEFVPEVRVRGAKDPQPELQILNLPTKFFFNENGLILLDGIPVQNTRELMDMNPLLLESIDVMNRRYFLGDWELNGVIQYKSYKRDLAGFTLSPGQLLYPFKGIQEKALPANPEPGKNNRLPDGGNLLFRELQVDITKEMKMSFYTTDAAGDYWIRVVATGKNGEEQEFRKKITVK
ncbi:MAG: hypothetical protein RL732_1600 [Bacteroidota bacterium]